MTDFVLLECNRLRGRLNYNQTAEVDDIFKNRWVNNVSSYGITINKGDVINVESVAINTSGTIQDTIELLGKENELGFIDNEVGFEFAYYVNHSGYSTIPLPLTSMETYNGYANNTLTGLDNARNRGLGEVDLTDYSTTPGTNYNNPNNMPKGDYNNVVCSVVTGLQTPSTSRPQFIQGNTYSTDTSSRPIYQIKAEEVQDGEIVRFSFVDLDVTSTYTAGLQQITVYADPPTFPSSDLTNTAVLRIFVADRDHVSTKKYIKPNGRRYFPAVKSWSGSALIPYTGLADASGINFDPTRLIPFYDVRTTTSKVSVPAGLVTPQNISTLITEQLQKPSRVDIRGVPSEFSDFDDYGIPDAEGKVPIVNTEVSKSMTCNFSTFTSPYTEITSLVGVRQLFYSNIAYENPEKIAGLQFSRQRYYGIDNDQEENEINSGNVQNSNIGDFGNQDIGELGLNVCMTRTFPVVNNLTSIQQGDLILTNMYYTEDNVIAVSNGFRRAERYYGNYEVDIDPNSTSYKSQLAVALDLGMYYDEESNPTLVTVGSSIPSGQRSKYLTGRELIDNPSLTQIITNVDAGGTCIGTQPPYYPDDDTRNDGQELSSIVVKSRYSATDINYSELYTHLTSTAGSTDMRVDGSTTSQDEVFNNSYGGRTITELLQFSIDNDVMVVPVWLDSTAGEYSKFSNRPYIAFVSALTTNTDTSKVYDKFSNTNWNIDAENCKYGVPMGLDCSFIRNNAVMMLNNNFVKDLTTISSAASTSYYQSYLNIGAYNFNVDFDPNLSRFFISDMNTPVRDGNGQPYTNPDLREFLGLVSPSPETQVVNINQSSASFNYLSGNKNITTRDFLLDFAIEQDPQSIIDSLTGVSLHRMFLYDKNDTITGEKFYFDNSQSINLTDTLLGKMGFTESQFFPQIGSPQTLFNDDTFNITENGLQGYFDSFSSFVRPLTTGAIFSSGEFQSTQTNIGNQPLFLLGGTVPDNTARPQVKQAQLNALLEPTQLSYPYLCVYSSIIQGGTSSKWYGGIDSKSQIPCVAFVPRYDNAGSFFYKGLEETFTFTATKDFSISEIETDIRLPDGSRPRLLPHSAVIYKITKPLNLSILPPLTTKQIEDEEDI